MGYFIIYSKIAERAPMKMKINFLTVLAKNTFCRLLQQAQN
jgi:hypothetical protein